ncbi:MAG: hypothetical protein Q8K98_06270 [Bacteroidota bacterium]|nr:hypothetical protein [Bacteroidota bacterium]
MAKEKSESKHVKLTEGQVPPKLNIAGELFQGGGVPPSLNLVGQKLEKGLVPQTMPKIPLDKPVQKPNRPSSESSSTSNSEQPANEDKK